MLQKKCRPQVNTVERKVFPTSAGPRGDRMPRPTIIEPSNAHKNASARASGVEFEVISAAR
jgi:hypothetical protein